MKVHKTGQTLGFFFALLHAVWEVLVALGIAQSLMDFKLSMHSLNNPFHVGAFSLGTAIELVIISYIGGYIIGSVFAIVYNKFNK